MINISITMLIKRITFALVPTVSLPILNAHGPSSSVLTSRIAPLTPLSFKVKAFDVSLSSTVVAPFK